MKPQRNNDSNSKYGLTFRIAEIMINCLKFVMTSRTRERKKLNSFSFFYFYEIFPLRNNFLINEISSSFIIQPMKP
jgi:hypothetical protein